MAEEKKTEKPAEKPVAKVEKSEVAKAVQETISELLPALVGALGAANGQTTAAPVQAAAPVKNVSTCPQCRQMVAACKGKHRAVCVLPSDEDAAQWFQGVKINGVNYLSAYQGHLVTVPAESNIEYMVQEWQRNERELVRGRKRSRHSGSVGPNGGNVQPVGDKDFFR